MLNSGRPGNGGKAGRREGAEGPGKSGRRCRARAVSATATQFHGKSPHPGGRRRELRALEPGTLGARMNPFLSFSLSEHQVC